MREMSEKEIRSLLTFRHEASAVFLYTPMCGTCKAASRMLEVLEEVQQGMPLYQCNMNTAPQLAQDWKIESIPCIVFMNHGKILEKMYAMQSVPVLYEKFKQYGIIASDA